MNFKLILFKTLFPRRIWNSSSKNRAIYLTFDDGPIPEVTEWIIDFLEQHTIKATFFCVGENVNKYPEIYQRLLHAGHQVGNHTMKHQNGIKTNPKEYFNSILKSEALIHSNLFRPPYGRLHRKYDKGLSKRFKIVMWSWLSKDYNLAVPTQKIIHRAKKIKSGDILLFHDNLKSFERLKIVLPPIIELLKSNGFQFKTL